MKKVKYAIIGFGGIAENRIAKEGFACDTSRVAALPNAELVGATDMNQSREAAAKALNLKWYKNMDEIFADPEIDAVYIATPHLSHYELSKQALLAGKHVLCEIPLVLEEAQARELYTLAEEQKRVLMEAHKTAYCPAFNHLMVMIKSGAIGEVVDIEASLSRLLPDKTRREFDPSQAGGSMYESAVYPLLPIFKLLGTEYKGLNIYSRMENGVDIYTKGVMRYPTAVCSFKLGLGVKTEGNLVISGTKGYAYVEAPWWKTDYFELRYEDRNKNKKFFYKWDEEGLRYEIQEWISCILNGRLSSSRLTKRESIAMASVMQQFTERKNFIEI